MNTLSISIILPVFNKKKMFSRAIDSCLKQTFYDFKLIIIDDCSTESSEGVCLA